MDRLETFIMKQQELMLMNLHSSMDRLETKPSNALSNFLKVFTFQYGQIRNKAIKIPKSPCLIIYIPVWIDQKRISRKRH